MSSIEDNVWDDIRFIGLPLYPQVPVGPYFLDFGDFKNRIGIEVDSILWHKDKQKDLDREGKIKKLGWKVFRINSWETHKTKADFFNKEGEVDMDRYYKESSEGILISIYKDYTDFFDKKFMYVTLMP